METQYVIGKIVWILKKDTKVNESQSQSQSAVMVVPRKAKIAEQAFTL